jgi:uncharacterized damage-inducible protein DinB
LRVAEGRRGRSPRGLPSAQEVPTLEALEEKWSAVEDGQRTFVEGLTESRMSEIVSYVNVKGETWAYPLHEMLVHVVNHSTYHRGQVATMLRQLGKTPQSTDYLVFLDGGGGLRRGDARRRGHASAVSDRWPGRR